MDQGQSPYCKHEDHDVIKFPNNQKIVFWYRLIPNNLQAIVVVQMNEIYVTILGIAIALFINK